MLQSTAGRCVQKYFLIHAFPWDLELKMAKGVAGMKAYVSKGFNFNCPWTW